MCDLYIAIAHLGFFVGLLLVYGARSLVLGRRRHARTEADGGSLFLNKGTMEAVYWILDPVVDFLRALHVTPNMITVFSLVPAAGAGVAAGFGWLGLASLLGTAAVFCDIFDGLLARRLGSGSPAGEVLDAAVDRYGEMLLLGGLVYYYREHDQVLFIVLGALASSFMVSYATAKAEAMGVPAPRGAMRRGERAAYIILGCALTPMTKALFASSPSLALREIPILLGLTIVAVVGNISVVQRLSTVIASLRAREPAKHALPEPPAGITPDPDLHVGSP